MQSLSVRKSQGEDGWQIAAQGELDASSAETFRQELEVVLASGSGDIHLDLCELQFIDSTGLHTLLNLQRRLVRQGRCLRVDCVSGAVMRLFELARLVETFDVRLREDAGETARVGVRLREDAGETAGAG